MLVLKPVGHAVQVYVHSKLLIVDDDLALVGAPWQCLLSCKYDFRGGGCAGWNVSA